MSDTTNSLINTITVGTTIKGDIQANGDFRMDGSLEGNITLTGKLVLGEQGRDHTGFTRTRGTHHR